MLFSKCDRFGFGNANGKSSSYSQSVSQKSRNFSGLFRVPQFSSYLRKAEVLSHQTSQSSWFLISYIKNVLKDQLLKTSGLQFDNRLSAPEKFSRFTRNRRPGLLRAQPYLPLESDPDHSIPPPPFQRDQVVEGPLQTRSVIGSRNNKKYDIYP